MLKSFLLIPIPRDGYCTGLNQLTNPYISVNELSHPIVENILVMFWCLS